MLRLGDIPSGMTKSDVISVALLLGHHDHDGIECFREVVRGEIHEQAIIDVCRNHPVSATVEDATPEDRDLFNGSLKRGRVMHLRMSPSIQIEALDIIEEWLKRSEELTTAYLKSRQGKEFVYPVCERNCCKGEEVEGSEFAHRPEQRSIGYRRPTLVQGKCSNGCCRMIDAA